MEPCPWSFDVLRVESWLSKQGYQIAHRHAGWNECLISAGGERWLGRGVGPAEALADAFAQVFPSRAARAALSEATLATVEARPQDASIPAHAPSCEPITSPDRADPFTQVECVSVKRSTPTAAIAYSSTRVVDASAAANVRVEGFEDSDPGHENSGSCTIGPSAPDARASRSSGQAHRSPHGDRARSRGRSTVWTRERQRLLFLGWISHARSIEEVARGDREVHAMVGEIARGIATLSRLWWPGSVPALQAGAAPCDCADELDLPLDEQPQSWLEVAERAEDRLVEIEERDAREGRGEHGWADDAALVPPPPDAEAMLRQVQADLSRSLANQDELEPARMRSRTLSVTNEIEIERIAQRVRWLRGSVDPETWSEAIGHLRRIASRFPAQRPGGLADVLDSAYRPPRSWALACGYDPEKKERQRRRREVLRAAPRGDENASPELVLEWLRRAIATRDLAHVPIAEKVTPWRDLVLAQDDKTFSNERWQRGLLRKIQQALTSAGSAAVPTEPTRARPRARKSSTKSNRKSARSRCRA